MKELNNKKLKHLKIDGFVFCVALIMTIVLISLVLIELRLVGGAISAILLGIMIYCAICLKRPKELDDIQKYKEILAYLQGKTLEEINNERNRRRKIFKSVVYAVICGIIISVIIALYNL